MHVNPRQAEDGAWTVMCWVLGMPLCLVVAFTRVLSLYVNRPKLQPAAFGEEFGRERLMPDAAGSALGDGGCPTHNPKGLSHFALPCDFLLSDVLRHEKYPKQFAASSLHVHQ